MLMKAIQKKFKIPLEPAATYGDMLNPIYKRGDLNEVIELFSRRFTQ